MKILTSLPASLGRALDLVERDVESSITVAQDALFPLGLFPYPVREGVGNPFSLNLAESFHFSLSARIANGAASALNLVTFPKGVWRIQADYQYWSNYSVAGLAGAQLAINTNPSSGITLCSLVNTFPSNGSITLSTDRILTITNDGPAQMVALLGANGVGQDHGIIWSIGVSRLL